VIGGKKTESGRLGAFVKKVKRGSVADKKGHLKRGDEVIMWDKTCLQDASYEQVCDAILASKSHRLVELLVSRPIEDTPRIPATRRHQLINQSSSSSFDSAKRDDDPYMKSRHVTSRISRHHQREYHPTSMSSFASSSQLREPHAPPGRLQVRLSYEVESEQLYVTIIKANDLTLRQGIFKRNPYVKMYLLPDRSESSKRRTKTEKKTLSPQWNQSFVYAPVTQNDLGSMSLELSLWDLDRSVDSNNHFIGEVIIDLGLAALDDRCQWYELLPIGCELRHKKTYSGNFTSRRDFSPNHNSRSSSQQAINQNNSSKSNFHICTSSSGSINQTAKQSYHEDPVNKRHRRKLPVTPMHASHTFFEANTFGSDGSLSMKGVGKHQKYFSERDLKVIYNQQEPKTRHLPQTGSSKQVYAGSNQSQPGSSPGNSKQKGSRWYDNQANAPSHSRYNESDRRLASNVDDRTDVNVVEPIIRSVNINETETERKNINYNIEKDNATHSTPERVIQQKLPHRQNNQSASRSRTKQPTNNQLFTASNEKPKRSKSSGQLANNQKQGSDKIRGSDSASASIASLVSEESTMGRMINDFIGVIGPGQIAGRDTVTARSMGDIQIGVSDRNGRLEVRIGNTRNLTSRPYAKTTPAPYLKVYLMSGSKCLIKKKTKPGMRTITPQFNQCFSFDAKHSANNLQVTVWGDHGRLDHKSFMGCAQIDLNSYDLVNKRKAKMHWYRLFQTSSLVDATSPGENNFAAGSITSGDSDLQKHY